MIEAPDSHEIDALESLVISDGWRVVAARVAEMIERKRDELEYQVHPDIRGPGSVENLQGFLAACRTVLELPAILQQEIQAQLKEK